MKILGIEPDSHRDYCSSQLLYEYLSSKPDCEVAVISPRHMCKSKGYVEAPEYDYVNKVHSYRIYNNLDEMWSHPNNKADRVKQIVYEFNPDLIYVHHEGSYPVFDIAISAKKDVKKVVFLEMPSHTTLVAAQQRKSDMVFSCERPDRLKEKELTQQYNMFILQINWSTGVPNPEQYWVPFENKLNQGIFAGTLQWPYKRVDVFIQTIPRLFNETPMKKFVVVSNDCLQLQEAKKALANFNIEWITSMKRWDLLKLIGQSFFGYTSLIETMPGVFPCECWAVKTVVFAPGIQNLVDDNNCVKQIAGVKLMYDIAEHYNRIANTGYLFWQSEESAEAVGERYYKAFKGIIENRTEETWNELRLK